MDFLLQNWTVVLVFIVSGAMLAWPAVQQRSLGVKQLGPQQATMLINRNKPVVLDIREPKDADGGRLPNAIHIPLSELSKRAPELRTMSARPVLVYCSRGQRTLSASRLLSKLGFKEIYGLAGGVRAWTEAHLPLEK